MRTLTWPGVCPGVGSSRTSAVIGVVARRPSRPGRRRSRLHRIGDHLDARRRRRPPASAAYSVRREQVARVRGTSAPSGRRARRVFQPTWSTCRWVHSTASTLSGAKPAPREVVEERAVQIVPHRDRPRLVVADAGVDDDAPCPRTRSTKAWIDANRRPSAVREVRLQPGMRLHSARLDGRRTGTTAGWRRFDSTSCESAPRRCQRDWASRRGSGLVSRRRNRG